MSDYGQEQQGDPTYYGGESYDYTAQPAQSYPPQPQQGSWDQGPQEFQSFDYTQESAGYTTYDTQYSGAPTAPVVGEAYTGSIMTPDQNMYDQAPTGGDDYENELPLLEELGINFDHIVQKTLAVLNPMKQASQDVVSDSDMAGPLVFWVAFGGMLLLSGKSHFGYIYGLGLVGCVAMYSLLNLMSMAGVALTCVVSILGYCLLPMVLLSSLGILLTLKGVVGTVLTASAVLWCSFSASKLFTSALCMEHQQLLVAYPCALVYALFALLTVF